MLPKIIITLSLLWIQIRTAFAHHEGFILLGSFIPILPAIISAIVAYIVVKFGKQKHSEESHAEESEN